MHSTPFECWTRDASVRVTAISNQGSSRFSQTILSELTLDHLSRPVMTHPAAYSFSNPVLTLNYDFR